MWKIKTIFTRFDISQFFLYKNCNSLLIKNLNIYILHRRAQISKHTIKEDNNFICKR